MSDSLRSHLESSLGRSYTIEGELSGGGMSRVFIATDKSLARRVVIKVLKPEMAAGVSMKRFEREIRLAASLQQANIVPVLAAGETDGLLHYVMPFVEGLSLRARLERQSRPLLAETISILRDVARALAYAHGHGVVHRDIKPENVLLSGDAAVVTDFGIAKAISSSRVSALGSPRAESTVTQIGTAIGTPAYMAPEQISGDPAIDHRADLYSFGCLAYEMLSGAPPFSSPSAHGLFAAHLSEPPVPLGEKNSDTPTALASLVMQCLEKDPARRPQSARDILQVLEGTATPATGLAKFRQRLTRKQRLAAIGVGAVVIVAAIAALWPKSQPPDDRPTLAVVPFLNVSGDSADEYLGDGIADGLATALGKVSGVKVASRSLGFRYKGQRAIDARDIGRTLGVSHVASGAVRRVGNRLRVTAFVTSASTNQEVWSESYDRSAGDLFAVQDEITRRIAAALGARLSSREAGGTARPATTDPDAYDLYLRGRFLLQRRGSGVRQASTLFQQAIAKDSTFAAAHAALALALELLPNFEPANNDSLHALSIPAARLALSLDSSLAEAHTALALAHQSRLDWALAEDEHRKAVAGSNEADAFIQYGRFLHYTGRLREALSHFERARELDPYSAAASGWTGHLLDLSGRNAEGIAELRRALEIDSTNPPALVFMADAQLYAGDRKTARVYAERLWRAVPAWRGNAASLLAISGEPERARAVARQLEATGRPTNLILHGGIVYAALRDSTKLFDALGRSTAAHEPWPAYYSLSERRFDFVRRSARFAAIVRSVGLDERIFTSPTGGRPH